MTDVQARAGRIRELDQAIELGLGVIAAGLEAVRLIPARLPFQLDFLGIVSLAHEKFLLIPALPEGHDVQRKRQR